MTALRADGPGMTLFSEAAIAARRLVTDSLHSKHAAEANLVARSLLTATATKEKPRGALDAAGFQAFSTNAV